MPEQTLKGSLEGFRDWCQRCGHYNALAAFDRYQMYESSKTTTEQAAHELAVSCED